MLRRTLIAAAVAGALAAPAAGQGPVVLMPGVTFEKQVQFTPHGPVAIEVLGAPRPGGLWGLKPFLSNDSIQGRETVTSIEQRASASATVAGINGDLFSLSDGRPSGILVRSGVLEHTPNPRRSSIGVDAAGQVHVDRVALFGTWQGSGQRRVLNGLNESPRNGGITLFTPTWGPATPAASGDVEVVLYPYPTTATGTELAGPVLEVDRSGGTPIPAGGSVLVARGAAAQFLLAEAPTGTNMRIRLILKPDWAGIVDGLGGGPLIVRDGSPVFRANEAFTTAQLNPRTGRAAVGQKADGSIVLVTVDGGRPGYSSGMTNFELAQTMVRLGAVLAAGLDSGGSATMAFDGQLLSRPSDPAGERPVSEALLVTYAGVYAPQPLVPILSPNGDGVADSQAVGYRLVRHSTVTAKLAGPDGVARIDEESVQHDPGTYSSPWNGLTADGRPELEGRWTWTVTAVDDQGQSSTAERDFVLDDTIGFRKTAGPPLAVPRPKERVVATFQLTRAAAVLVTFERENGVVLRSLAPAILTPGPQTVAWDGLDGIGNVVAPGTYVVRVVATSDVGRSELVSPPFEVKPYVKRK